ncbi:MAG: hypothetical protein MRY74_16475 [Neomegalonema sp.]|nr:hypothetical protein [Neomegalonema sp.]
MPNPLAMPFAQHIAHLLNKRDDDGLVRINPWRLFLRLEQTLLRGRGGGYVLKLVGLRTMGLNPDRMSDREDGVARWFDAVMERPLEIHSSRDRHKAHDLLEALVRRSPEFGPARLERRPSDSAAAAQGPAQGLYARLAQFEKRAPDPAVGRRGAALRREQGPLMLIIGDAAAPTPETLSVWSALSLIPSVMRPLEGDEALAFSYLMIQLIETADERWNSIRRLGLSPPEWIEDLSINRARDVGILMSAAGPRPDQDALAAAWRRVPVPGFDDLDAFFASDIGRAMCAPVGGGPRFEPLDEAPEPRAPIADKQATKEEMLDAIELFRARGRIDPFDLDLLAAVAEGANLTALWRRPNIRARFDNKAAFVAHTDKVSQALIREVREIEAERALSAEGEVREVT